MTFLVCLAINNFNFCRKIAQYSPSESTKLYDKAMQRRTINPFSPKATIALLKEDLKIGCQLSENEKRVLVDRYLEVRNRIAELHLDEILTIFSYLQFKQLMIKLDPEEDAEEDDANKTPQKMQLPPPNTSQAMENDVTMNHQHVNNVQINMARLPNPMEATQNYVRFAFVPSLNCYSR